MIFFFLTSGLFLGWSLGANDAANIFGSAVGSRMISFIKAAVIASVFLIIGAVFQGAGAAETLGRLGAVNAIGYNGYFGIETHYEPLYESSATLLSEFRSLLAECDYYGE